jgi:hypothetical protein
MNEEGAVGPIPVERRKELWARIPGFADLPAEALLTAKYLKKKSPHTL